MTHRQGMVLDEALGAMRLAAAGLVTPLLCSLPWWLLLAEGARLLFADGPRPSTTMCLRWSALAIAALLLAAWGRAAWARQVATALDGGVAPSPRPTLMWGDFAVVIWLHGLVVLGSAIGSWLLLPLLFLPWGLALAAASPAIRPGATARQALGEVLASATPMKPWLGVCISCAWYALLVGANLWFAAYGLAGLLADVVGLRAHVWTERLAVWNTGPWIAAIVVAWALIDPVLIAAAVVHQRRRQARSTGSDLSAWLTRLERQP